MYDLRTFRERVMELCARAQPYGDGRRASQQDLAVAVGLSRPALSNRLNGTRGSKLTERDVRAIVRALVEWEAISTRAEALELLALVNCPSFTEAEWQSPPLDLLTTPKHSNLKPQTSALKHNLPLQLTSFIGRAAELEEAARLLRRGRLLTLLGPGGCGKTRLAVALGERAVADFADGVWLAELSSLDATLVGQAVARAVGLREPAGLPLLDALIAHLRDRETLLVLDNCEHVVDAVAALVHRLLSACAGLKVLATSRERLRTRGEISWAIPAMATPAQGAVSAALAVEYEAVRLFVVRAQDVNTDLHLDDDNAAAICQICARLDGLPLAIELAAALTAEFDPATLAAQLHHRLPLLTGGARELEPRQQTLRGAIDWSYDLLTDDERRLFARFAVFAGGATFDAAEEVCAATDKPTLPSKIENLKPTITELTAKSLIRPDGEGRLLMLETLREYAMEKLVASGEGDTLRQRHAAYYLRLAEDGEAKLGGGEQLMWLERLEREHDNFRAALGWSIEQSVETALLLGRALWRFWYVRGYTSEGRGWLEAGLAKAGGVDEAVRARALNSVGVLAWQQGDYAAARQFLEEGLVTHRKLDYKLGVSATLNNLGLIALAQGEYDRAETMFGESLPLLRELGDEGGVAATLDNLGRVAMFRGDYATAQARCVESLDLKRWHSDERGVAFSLNSLGRIAYLRGDDVTAAAMFAQSRTLYTELGSKQGLAEVNCNIGLVALRQGDYEGAGKLLCDSLAVLHEQGSKSGIADALSALARLAVAQAEGERAVTLYAVADWLRRSIGAPPSPAEQAEQAAQLDALRTNLGVAFNGAWATGQAMTLGAAVEYALA